MSEKGTLFGVHLCLDGFEITVSKQTVGEKNFRLLVQNQDKAMKELMKYDIETAVMVISELQEGAITGVRDSKKMDQAFFENLADLMAYTFYLLQSKAVQPDNTIFYKLMYLKV